MYHDEKLKMSKVKIRNKTLQLSSMITLICTVLKKNFQPESYFVMLRYYNAILQHHNWIDCDQLWWFNCKTKHMTGDTAWLTLNMWHA